MHVGLTLLSGRPLHSLTHSACLDNTDSALAGQPLGHQEEFLAARLGENLDDLVFFGNAFRQDFAQL